MKVEVEKQETFKPIKLTVTIESEQEFCDLFHRVNASASIVNNNEFKLKHEASYEGNLSLYRALKHLVDNEYQYLKTK